MEAVLKDTAKKIGRPPRGATVKIGADLSPKAADALEALAQTRKVKKWEVIERLLLDAANGPPQLPVEAQEIASEAADFIEAHSGRDAATALKLAWGMALALAKRNTDKEFPMEMPPSQPKGA